MEKDGEIFSTHWYEFITTHLIEKLFNPDPKQPNRGLQEQMKKFFWDTSTYWFCVKHGDGNFEGTEHPVDVLYNYFKENFA